MGDFTFMGEDELNTNGLEFENIEQPKEQKEGGEQEDLAIQFSIKLMGLLESKAESHNSDSPDKKVSLTDLQKVYSGAKNCYDAKQSGKDCGEWALARVNMFLRQKRGEKMILSDGSLTDYNLIDISELWAPSEQDFIKSQAEIQEHELDYKFEDVNELYVEPYEQHLGIEW